MCDSDGGSALFSVTGLAPATAPVIRCIRVRYDGSLGAEVRLLAARTAGGGGDLAPLFADDRPGRRDHAVRELRVLHARRERVSSTPAWSPRLPTAWAGVVDPFNETWTTNETHSYRLTLTPRAGTTGAAMQGRSLLFTLTWEARNR